MQRRTVQDSHQALPAGSRPAARGTVAKVAVALATCGATLVLAGGPTGAQPTASCDGEAQITVVEAEGLLDTVLVDFVEEEIAAAPADCDVAVVLQLDSGGATVSDERLDELVSTIESSPVPVDVWVGPTGSRAVDEAARLVAAAEVVGVAPGASVEVSPALLDASGVDPTELGDVDVGDRVGGPRAADLGVVDNDAPVVGDFVISLPGVETEAADGGLRPVTPVRFASPDIVAQLMHTVASPPVAYLLFVVGLTLLLFELQTRPVGVGLLIASMVAYGVDVQTGVPRLWTGIGTVAFVLGSLALYDGVSVSW